MKKRIVMVVMIFAMLMSFLFVPVTARAAETTTLYFYKTGVKLNDPYNYTFTVTTYGTLTPLEKKLADLIAGQSVGSHIVIKAKDLNEIHTFISKYQAKTGSAGLTVQNMVDENGQIIFATTYMTYENGYYIEYYPVTEYDKGRAAAIRTETVHYVELLRVAYNAVVNAGVNNNMTQSEAYECIKNYVESVVDYDYTNDEYRWHETLKTGKGICFSYSNLVAAMCTICGIPCERVESIDMNHSWNRVRIDGEWYWSDVTWDDVRHTYGKSVDLWQDHNYNDVVEKTFIDTLYEVFEV